MMREFTCSCEWRYVIGKKRVFGPMFKGPAEHHAYWHVGRMMSREEFEDQYGDCALRFAKQQGTVA